MANKGPDGVIGLADAIDALRAELIRAWSGGKNQPLRFKPSPVELTVQVAVTSSGKGNVGVRRLQLFELGGSVSRESAVTQNSEADAGPSGLRRAWRTATHYDPTPIKRINRLAGSEAWLIASRLVRRTPATERIALNRCTRGGEKNVGSGLRIGRQFVLTVIDCVDGTISSGFDAMVRTFSSGSCAFARSRH